MGSVFIENGAICIKFNEDLTPYQIEVGRCDSYPKIVYWVAHLSEKSWCTSEIINDFIDTVCRYHGLNYRDDGAS